MEKISWVHKKRNEEILNMVQEDKKNIKHNKHEWMGRVLRHDGLLHDLLEGRMLGKRTSSRRRIQLTGYLLENKNYTDLKKAAEDKSVLRTIR